MIILATVFLVGISIFSYFFFIQFANNLRDVAIQNIQENTKSNLFFLPFVISDKLNQIITNLRILSNMEYALINTTKSVNLLNLAQESSQNFTLMFGLYNGDQVIKSSSFKNPEMINKISNTISQIFSTEKLKKLAFSHKSFYSPSLSSIFFFHPFLIKEESDNLVKKSLYQNNTLSANSEQKIDMGQKTGILFVVVNSSQIGQSIQNLVKNESHISLIDNNGTILYSSDNVLKNIFKNDEKNKYIENNFDEENQRIINNLKNSIISGKTQSLFLSDIQNKLFTLTYATLNIDDVYKFNFLINTPYNIDDMEKTISQRQTIIISTLIITGIVIFVLITIISILNFNLKRKVEERTRDLKISEEFQKELNKKLVQNNQLQKEFINIAAHELRTPTQSIIGYIEMMKNFPENYQKYIGPLERNSDRLYRLTQDILDVARIESNTLKIEKEKFDLVQLVEDTVSDFSDRNKNTRKNIFKITNNSTREDKSIFVNADKRRIEQVVYNLISNADKFTNNDTIFINLSTTTGNYKMINKVTKDADKTQQDDTQYAFFTIKDSGGGIDNEILPRLFEKFASRSEVGTGLGLYISKNIIEAHKGKIWGKNNNTDIKKQNLIEKKGAEFGFMIPSS